MLSRLSQGFFHFLSVLIVLMMTGMMILVGCNVALRLGWNTGLDFADELPRFMFIWLVFCGSTIALKEGTHIGVNMFVQMANRGVQKIFYLLTQLLVMMSGAYITYGSILTYDTIVNNASAVMQINTVWVYGVTYIAGPAMVFIALYNVIRLVRNAVSDAELASTHEDDADELAERAREKATQEGSFATGERK